MIRTPFRFALFALLLAACGGGSAALRPNGPLSKILAAATPEMAPTPYTAEQIRQATAVGRAYDFLVEQPGRTQWHHILTFTRVSAIDADVISAMFDETGTQIRPATKSLVTWEELRRHAEFPRDAVEITAEKLTVPVGTFDCVRYTVTDHSGPDPVVLRFYFAKDMPGAPIFFYTERGGKRIMTSTLVRYVSGETTGPSPTAG